MSGKEVNLLVARLVDGEISHTESRELAGLIEMNPEFGYEVRGELELSDLLSQKFHETRSANAFMAAMKGRFRADRSATRFVAAAVDMIEKSERPKRKRATKKTIWWLLPVAACLAVIVGSFRYNEEQAERLPERIVARIKALSSDVEITRKGEVVLATIGMDLLPGDRIKTKSTQRVTCSYPGEKTTVLLDGRTELEFQSAEKGRRLFIEKGKIDARVASGSAYAPFVVATPHAECEIKGTRFMLTVRSGRTRVEVSEGIVALKQLADGAVIQIGAGEFAEARKRGGTLMARASKDPPDRILPPVKLSEDGPEIFRDEFTSGMENWEPVIEDDSGRFRPLNESEAGLVEWDGQTLQRKAEPGVVVMHANLTKDKQLGIRLKRDIPPGSIIIEYEFKGQSGSFFDVKYGPGVEWTASNDYFPGKYSTSWNVERRELIRLKPKDGFERYDHRCWYYRGAEGKYEPETVSADSLRMKGERQIIITGRARKTRIGRVVIRKLAKPGAR